MDGTVELVLQACTQMARHTLIFFALSDRRVLGRLKRERYYGRRFTKRENPVWMIEDYITYYNNRRVQRNLGVLTPTEKHYCYPLEA